MAKDANTILKDLGLNENSSQEDLLNKLNSLEIASQSEIMGVKSVSVTTLPTIVKNSEKELKAKMINIVTDEDKGSIYLINKRTVLINKILSKLNNKIVTNESNISLSFNKLNEEKQNKVMSNGKEVETAIIDLEKRTNANTQSIANLETNKADKTYVNSIITELDSRLTAKITEKFNQILGEGASETLDTIGEISKALEEHNNEYDSLLAVVGDKADRSELFSGNYNDLINKPTIPTKLSQLEIDMEIGGGSGGISEEQVVDIVDTKIANLVNSAPETLDTLGEVAQAIQENENVVDALNKAIINKADKSSVESVEERLGQAESDIADLKENSGGVSEEEVLEIIEENSQAVGGLKLATSEDYDTTSEAELPTTKAVKKIVDTKVADLVNSAPETLDTLGEVAQAIQENENVVEALNNAIGNKADKSSVESVEERLGQAESDIADLKENSGGVSEDDVMNIIEENSETAEELEIVESETLNIGTSVSYDETSDSEIPTTKAVKTMIGNGGSNELAEKIEVNYEDLGESFYVSIHIENNDFDFTKPFRINLYESETARENELHNKDGSYHNYLTFEYNIVGISATSVVNNEVYSVNDYSDYLVLDTYSGIFQVAFIIPYEAENHLIAEIFIKEENNFLTIASVHGTKRTYTTPLVYYET